MIIFLHSLSLFTIFTILCDIIKYLSLEVQSMSISCRKLWKLCMDRDMV